MSTDKTNTGEVLEQLATRVESATGPDRELDADIAVAIFGLTPAPFIEKSQTEPHQYLHPNGRHIAAPYARDGIGPMADYGGSDEWGGFGGWVVFTVPPFTASLDAAMKLAVGLGGQVTFFKDGTAKAFLWQPYPMAVEAKAATPALALAAAALRARAQS